MRESIKPQSMLSRTLLAMPLAVMLLWQLKLVAEFGLLSEDGVMLAKWAALSLVAWATYPAWTLVVEVAAYKIDEWRGVHG